MTRQELIHLIADIQRRQSELDNIEVKTARGGTPKRLFEALSAFSNRSGGGIILFGLSESSDFSIVGVGDAHRLQEEITQVASSEMEPALRPQFLVDEIDGEIGRAPAAAANHRNSTADSRYFRHAWLPGP